MGGMHSSQSALTSAEMWWETPDLTWVPTVLVAFDEIRSDPQVSRRGLTFRKLCLASNDFWSEACKVRQDPIGLRGLRFQGIFRMALRRALKL